MNWYKIYLINKLQMLVNHATMFASLMAMWWPVLKAVFVIKYEGSCLIYLLLKTTYYKTIQNSVQNYTYIYSMLYFSKTCIK